MIHERRDFQKPLSIVKGLRDRVFFRRSSLGIPLQNNQLQEVETLVFRLKSDEILASYDSILSFWLGKFVSALQF